MQAFNHIGLAGRLSSEKAQQTTHKIIDFDVFDDTVIMQGQVNGTFYPKTGESTVNFKTKNLFVFKRIDSELKIVKVIYNRSPLE